MEDKLNVEESGLGINVEPKEEIDVQSIAPVEELLEEVALADQSDEDDLNKKTYFKISPTLYVKAVVLEEGEEPELDDEGNEITLFKVFNPETGEVEKRPLTDEEKHEIFILDLKASKKVFKSTKHPTRVTGTYVEEGVLGRKRTLKEREVVSNVTINKFPSEYKAKRKRKKNLTKQSRRANR